MDDIAARVGEKNAGLGMSQPTELLSGWKDISGYLGISVRWAQVLAGRGSIPVWQEKERSRPYSTRAAILHSIMAWKQVG